MNKKQALALAKKVYSEYNVYIRGNEVIVRDGEELITKIPFKNEKQLELPLDK